MITLYPHQQEALEQLKDLNKVALYWDMGLGKTFGGSEKMKELGARVNLVICQKSKIDDWVEHFNSNYCDIQTVDLTKKCGIGAFMSLAENSVLPYNHYTVIGVINYELAFRRPELSSLTDFTLMLDESSLIQNEKAKRSKFILKKLQPKNVILLSGTPTGGKYERLWSQLRLLGWDISKTAYYNSFIEYHFEEYAPMVKTMVIDGYKNVDRLKRKMREYGCHFLKTDEVMELPEQIFTTLKVPASKEYRKFRKDRVVTVGDELLVGDNTLINMLYERELCGQYSKDKLAAFEDLIESTEDRLIVFYNFTAELHELVSVAFAAGRPTSIINGHRKSLYAYEQRDNSVTFIQYQAGAMGLNLQKANKIIYYSPPLSSELYEQSKKRINRIGQERTCYYYNLIVKGSIEERIYKTLAMRKDFTERLFEEVKQ